MVTMGFVAAATSRVGIGTSVLVIPLRPPVLMAKMLATIDQLSGGRVILGAAAGWLESEFEALGVPFQERGARTDEALMAMRRLWTEDPVNADLPVHHAALVNMRAKPQPIRHIPLWVGGNGPAALRRAAAIGDGWHGAFAAPELTRELVAALRSQRPEPGFVVSMRVSWDGVDDDPDELLTEFEAYRAAGVNHFVFEPRQRTVDGYLRSCELLAQLSERAGAALH